MKLILIIFTLFFASGLFAGEQICRGNCVYFGGPEGTVELKSPIAGNIEIVTNSYEALAQACRAMVAGTFGINLEDVIFADQDEMNGMESLDLIHSHKYLAGIYRQIETIWMHGESSPLWGLIGKRGACN